MNSFDDCHILPPEEFVPRPDSGAIFDVLVAIGWDGAAIIIKAPEAFLEWERDKEGSVCNPDIFRDMPKTPGVYQCKLSFWTDTEAEPDIEGDVLYAYFYSCESYVEVSK